MDNMLNNDSLVSYTLGMPAFGALSALNKKAYLCPTSHWTEGSVSCLR